MATRSSRSAFYAEDGYDGNQSPREVKRTTPSPPPGALEDILRRWRLPEAHGEDKAMTERNRTEIYDQGDNIDGYEEGDEEDDSMEDTEPERHAITAASPEGAKRHRYLREVDRHMILQRIDKGEKQAELAREFGVTRAAICHINKNRSQILARSTRPDVHEAARHPKRRMSTAIIAQRHLRQQQRTSTVYEVPSPALAIHMATLRNRETDTHTFRATADRACLLLTEEALASSSADSVQHNSTCAMVLGEGGLPLMKAFRSLQPNSPTGFMTLASDAGNQDLVLRKMSAPLGLRDHDVFLLHATCATGDAVCVAIRSLLDFGAQESRICFVTLVATVAAVTQICGKYPGVRITTTTVDPEWTGEATGSLGVDSFVERYFNSTIIHMNDSGVVVGL